MKKQIFTFVSIALFSFSLHAQVNVVPSGKVGIGGITAPDAKLQVLEAGSSTTKTNFTQDIGTAGFLLKANYSVNAYTPGFFWHTYDNNSTKPKAGIYLKTTSTGSYMYLGTSNNYATGITNDGLIITNSGTLQSTSSSAAVPTYSFTGSINTGMFSSGAGILNFSNGGSEKMRIESDGDVCIGATSSSVKGRLYVVQDNSTDAGCGLRVYKSSTGIGYNIISQVSDTGAKALVVQNSGDKFCVFGNGHTHIGAVYGYNPWMLTVWGTTYSYAGYQSSDMLFKQNITPVSSAIDKLNQLNGYRYSYNNTSFPERNFPSGFTYGVSAQEIQAVLPELVQADSLGYLAVNYNGLIPILIEALKEQNATITQQGQQIILLQKMIQDCCKAVTPEIGN